jgi:hypothetical protein
VGGPPQLFIEYDRRNAQPFTLVHGEINEKRLHERACEIADPILSGPINEEQYLLEVPKSSTVIPRM